VCAPLHGPLSAIDAWRRAFITGDISLRAVRWRHFLLDKNAHFAHIAREDKDVDMNWRQTSIAFACCFVIGVALLKATNVSPAEQSALLSSATHRSATLGDMERASLCAAYREWSEVAKDKSDGMEALCRDL